MNTYDYLYYPYINFRDDTWLKKMALYADTVARIVPNNYPTLSSKTVDVLTQEKFINNFSPYDGGDHAAKLFSKFLCDYRDELLPQYSVDNQAGWSSDLEDAHVRKELETGQAYIEASKLDGADIDALVNSGLVIQGRDGDLNWMGMHPRLANTFMTLLMNGLLSNNPNLKPVADFGSNAVDVHLDTEADLIRTLIGHGSIKSTEIDANDAFVTFAFEQVLPANIDELDIEDILNLRQKFPSELRRFQDAVNEFTAKHKELEGFKNTDRMIQHLGVQYNKEVKPAIDDLQGAFSGIKIDTVISAMGISFTPPGLLTSIGLAFNPILASIAGGALAVAQVLRASNQAKDTAIKSCDYSWLYRVEKEVQPTSMLSEISQRAANLWH